MNKNHVFKKRKNVINPMIKVLMLFLLLSSLLYHPQLSPIAYGNTTDEEELGFEELQAINSDVFGWINIYGTNIDYSMVQGEDNDKYIFTNARGEPARAGAIFLDFRNNSDLSDFNNIIYGHDMARGAMFGDIANFTDSNYFDRHSLGMLFNGQTHYGIELFALMLVDANDTGIYNPTMTDPADKEVLIERIFNEALISREVDITIDDRLVLLSTCTPTATNGRHILVGRLMEEVPADLHDGISAAPGLFGIGYLGLATGSFLVIIVTAAITIGVARIKKKKPKPKLGPNGEILPEDDEEEEKKKRPPTLVEEILFLLGKIAVILLCLGTLFTFVFGFVQVHDAAMAPAMQEGDIVFFQRLTRDYIATDTVVIRYDGQPQVRRVVAVEGDVVDITADGLMINGLFQQELHIFEETTQFVEGVSFPIVVPEGEVFLLGDSRARAHDSRIYGTVRVDDILGSVVTVIRRRNM